MRMTAKVEGLKELETALKQFARSTQRGVLERTLKKAAAPVAATARNNAPVDTGALKASIVIEVKRTNAGKVAFAEALRSGATRTEAGRAARSANRAAAGQGASAMVRVRAKAPHAIFAEYGTVKSPAHPFLGPALQSNRTGVFATVRQQLAVEIAATAKRVAARNARRNGK